MKVPPQAARRPRLLVGADSQRFCVCRGLPRNHQIRRRHPIRATKERLRKRDRPLVPRRRNPLCVCPWGNPKGGPPLGHLLPCAKSIALRGGPGGRPKSGCLSCVYVPAAGSSIPQLGTPHTNPPEALYQGQPKSGCASRPVPWACAAATRCLFARRGSQRGFAPLVVFPPFLPAERGPARRAKRVWDIVPKSREG